jgi:hypothetical protein
MRLQAKDPCCPGKGHLGRLWINVSPKIKTRNACTEAPRRRSCSIAESLSRQGRLASRVDLPEPLVLQSGAVLRSRTRETWEAQGM